MHTCHVNARPDFQQVVYKTDRKPTKHKGKERLTKTRNYENCVSKSKSLNRLFAVKEIVFFYNI